MGESTRAGAVDLGRPAWVALLARLTDGFVRAVPAGGSPAAARLPGVRSADPVTAIEGFSRMAVAWAAWLHEPTNPDVLVHDGRHHALASILGRGLADGTDPGSPRYWGPMADRDQRIVEAAEIATALWLGGSRLRRALADVDRDALDRVLDWIGLVDGRDVWPDNWVLFPMLSALVRRQHGRPVSLRAIDDAVDWMLAHRAGDGWYRDGAGHALDLYTGWAIHWHLLWWATIDGGRRPRVRARVVRDARAWLSGVGLLFASDGSFPRFGRSLGYRFALGGPFAQAALLGCDPLSPGQARRIAGGAIASALAGGAVDPASDWLRVGVGGERPAVVEGYVSAGAVAWAAHAFVALAMPETHSFWSAPPAALVADGPRSGWLASPAAGVLATWDGATGETRLLNASIGHPPDIPDHDYAATYGKLTYRSGFPFDVPVAGGSAGSDDALVAIDAAADADAAATADADAAQGHGAASSAAPPAPMIRLAHRNESDAGSAGPGWIWSAYRLPTRPSATRVRTVVLVAGPTDIRVSAVSAGVPVRIRDGGAALGIDDGAVPDVRRDDARCLVALSGARGTAAIRGLVGFDRTGIDGTSATRVNLVADAASHPFVEESIPRRGRRLLVSAALARVRDLDASAELGTLSAVASAAGRIDVTGPGWSAAIRPDARGRSSLEVDGWRVEGHPLRIVRVGRAGTTIAGERIRSVDGAFELERPAIVSVERVAGAVEAVVECGIELDPAWSGVRLTRLAWRIAMDPWRPLTSLERAGAVPGSMVRRLARMAGTRMVSLRLEPAS